MVEGQARAKFIDGSTMRHVVVMTLTGALGIMALFLVDFFDLYFISQLKQTAMTAAIGYAGTIILFNISIGMGSSIAASALVAHNLGSGSVDRAREYATNTLLTSLIISTLVTLTLVFGSGYFLSILGAEGETNRIAQNFIWTMTPGFILVGGELCCAAILRALGDARRAMYITLASAIVTLCFDPILIFGLDLGVQGAAIATVLGYLTAFSIGFYSLIKTHRFLKPIELSKLVRDYPAIWAIAGPGILSQLTLPFSNAYLTHLIASYGDEAVAGFAIICRIIPVAYGVIFALAGAVGPIIGQNHGASNIHRVRRTLNDALIFSTIYTLGATIVLFMYRQEVVVLFSVVGRTSDIILYFCKFIALSWIFVAAQFLASAAFNNLGYPKLSLYFNWGKATLGTIPFALLGSHIAGPEGMLAGNAVGAVISGLAAIATVYWIVNRSKSADNLTN